MLKIPDITKPAQVFGIVDHLPKYEDIPAEFKDDNNIFVLVVSRWFYRGLKPNVLITKEGADRAKALAALKAIMVSYEPKHEHKMAGVSYLMSEWFNLDKQVLKKEGITS